jgi:hypothetical protein
MVKKSWIEEILMKGYFIELKKIQGEQGSIYTSW